MKDVASTHASLTPRCMYVHPSENENRTTQACAPWGNVCVVAGTHYIPIALPSILGTVFLLAPLVAVAAKLQQSAAEVTRKDLRIEELEEEVDRLTRGLERGKE